MFEFYNLFTSWSYLTIICGVLFIYLRHRLTRPFNLKRDVYKYNWSKDRTASQNEDLPPIYPNGWTPVCESRDVKCSQIKPVFAFGKDLVVYRGQSGQCYAFDAYCSHLGANLGVGGTIVGESVECPFHGWVYNEEGKCTHIPGVDHESN